MADLSAHDAAMIAKVDSVEALAAQATASPLGGSPTPAPTAATRPEHVPEKFWDAATGQVRTEELLKSYTELERAKPAEAAPGAPDAAAQAAAAVSSAKLDMSTLSQEYATSGALSDASYAALASAGFDKGTVDTFIAGQAALAAQQEQAGYALAGGQEAYTAMASWAATAFTPAELTAYNQAVASGPVATKQAVLALKAQYEAAVGKDPQLLSGNSAVDNSGDQPFASRAEVTAAMRDPKYKSDPAYRALVERRIGAMSTF